METITKTITWFDATKPKKEHEDLCLVVYYEKDGVITCRIDIQICDDNGKIIFVDDNFNEITFPISHYATWSFFPAD